MTDCGFRNLRHTHNEIIIEYCHERVFPENGCSVVLLTIHLTVRTLRVILMPPYNIKRQLLGIIRLNEIA